ncbi:MFS transporter [Prauserella alba]|uniref:Lysosomal dipeptide transporter MFSD1 n=1 Tax=Prauserella alba TaxID=176898 RepID=A0ABP4GI95_9PSEU|nr:MFS transporter [Prauserella alba]MCP2179802.1 Sugar phosphate permease [Prauserella alba]
MPTSEPVNAPSPGRAWLVWGVGAFVYLLALFHRASFGVAGLDAAERFGVGAAALGTFTVLQVGVYAAMQIPTGLLVDRYGPRAVLTAAALMLGSGQVLLALVDTYALGLLARAVLGVGDALAFVSVLRLAANHFPGRQYVLVTTLTGSLGFVGNLAATLPLALLLSGPGWTPTFLVAGLVTLAYAAVVLVAVRDTPERRTASAEARSLSEVGGDLRAAWRVPGTRLGFWTHFSMPFSLNVMTLLWGVPYLVEELGYTETSASSLLMVFVVGAMLSNPLAGGFFSRRPDLRMPTVLGYGALLTLTWAVLLAWPGQVPIAVLVVAFVLMSLGAPVSSVGFALVRDYNPLPRVGTATGAVNVGGFCATTAASLLVGVLLELTGREYRIALLAIVAVLVFGTSRVVVWFRRARAAVLAAQERGEDVPVPVTRTRWDLASAA